jgi:Na+/melibiose symporter-like transporter
MLSKTDRRFIGIGVLVLLIWIVTLLLAMLLDREKAGQLGDSFGGVTSLFSALAFAGLIYTIFLQKRELESQREELRLQREEMAGSREQLASQARLQEKALKLALAQMEITVFETEVRSHGMATGQQNTCKPILEKMKDIIEVMRERIDG